MRLRLVLQLSLFGLAMAFATVSLVGPQVEPALWFVVFVFCATVIARRAPTHTFLHGVGVGLVNSVWMTTAHVAFAATYLARHPQEAEMAAHMESPRLMMVVTGPTFGLMSGVVLGAFALVARRLLARRGVEPATET